MSNFNYTTVLLPMSPRNFHSPRRRTSIQDFPFDVRVVPLCDSRLLRAIELPVFRLLWILLSAPSQKFRILQRGEVLRECTPSFFHYLLLAAIALKDWRCCYQIFCSLPLSSTSCSHAGCGRERVVLLFFFSSLPPFRARSFLSPRRSLWLV